MTETEFDILGTIAKRIQTRLSKRGVKVPQSDIRITCKAMISDFGNISEEEIKSVVEHFIDANKTSAIELQFVEETGLTAVVVEENNKMVAGAAHQMGIVLSSDEIAVIAENYADSTASFDENMDAIRNAITSFVQYKSQLSQLKIDEVVNEMREVISRENMANTQRLSDGFAAINSDIQRANTDFKSQVGKALSAFTLPNK